MMLQMTAGQIKKAIIRQLYDIRQKKLKRNGIYLHTNTM